MQFVICVRKAWVPVLLTTAFLYPQRNVFAQAADEYEVKAVFLYNFVNFVEWPSSSFNDGSQPFVIGVAGKNVFGTSLIEAVKGEFYRGHRIEVWMVNNPAEASKCHILYIEKSCTIFQQVLAMTKGKPILTIADTDDFMVQGGMIRFFMENNKVRIEVNQKVVNSHQLVISSKLLRLARIYNN